MDTIIPRKNKKFRYLAIAIAVFLVLLTISVFAFNTKRTLNVKADELVIQKAEKAFLKTL